MDDKSLDNLMMSNEEQIYDNDFEDEDEEDELQASFLEMDQFDQRMNSKNPLQKIQTNQTQIQHQIEEVKQTIKQPSQPTTNLKFDKKQLDQIINSNNLNQKNDFILLLADILEQEQLKNKNFEYKLEQQKKSSESSINSLKLQNNIMKKKLDQLK